MGNLYSGSNQTRILKRFTKDKKLARKTAHHLLWSLRSSGVSLGQQRIWRHGFYPWVRKIPWRREWQPTPVFLPGEFHVQRSLVGYSSQSQKESDTTEWILLRSSGDLVFLFLNKPILWRSIQFNSVQSLSPVRLFVTPWTVAHQAPLYMEFSRQEYWSGLPLPSSFVLVFIFIYLFGWAGS